MRANKYLAKAVKNAIAMVSTGKNAYLAGIEKFIAILLGMKVPVLPGAARTDGKVMYLPPQELDEKGKMIYLGKALHETAHLLIDSDFDHYKMIGTTHKHGMLVCRLINTTDDIRVENGFQTKYPRVVDTTRPYWLWKEAEVLPDLDDPQILQGDLIMVVMNVCMLFIARCRFRQLGLTMTYQPNKLIADVYDKYFVHLEDEACAQVVFQDSVDLAMKIYDRIKDMIRDDVQPPAPPAQPQEDGDDQDDDQQGQGSMSQNESEDDNDENKQTDSDSDDSEDSDGDDGSTGDEDDDSSEDAGGSGESSDGEQSDPGDDDSAGSDAASDDDGDESSESGDDPDESDEDSGSDGDSDDSDDIEQPGESSGAGDASDDGSESDRDSDDSDGEDTGEPEDEGDDSDESESGSEDESEEESDTKSDGEDSEPESDDAGDESGEESDEGDEESQDQGEDAEDEGSESSDEVEDGDSAGHGDNDQDQSEETDEEIDGKVQKHLDNLNSSAYKIKSDDDIVTDKINASANQESMEYYKDPNTQDRIVDGYEGSDYEAQRVKADGIKLLGKNGREMIRHFITQTRPHVIRRQDAGRFDVQTFLQDRYRQDVFNQKIKGALDYAAIAIALDNSGSMQGKQSYIAARLLSGLLYHCDRNDIPTIAAGYTVPLMTRVNAYAETREYPVRIDIIKRFDDRYNAQIMRRCCPLPDSLMGITPDLDCLRWITPQLWVRPEEKKILFVICDGEPQAYGDKLTLKLRYSYKQYIKACKEAGIKIFGFGIEADISEYFEEDWAYVTSSSLSDTFIERLRIILNS